MIENAFRPKEVSMSPFQIWAQIFNRTEGRFFTVVFRKADGSIRRLNGRIFAKIDPTEEQKHIIVKDVQLDSADKFRKVDPAHIIGFKCAEFVIGSMEGDMEKNIA